MDTAQSGKTFNVPELQIAILGQRENKGEKAMNKKEEKGVEEVKLYVNDEQVGACETIKLSIISTRPPIYVAELMNFEYNNDFLAAVFGMRRRLLERLMDDENSLYFHIDEYTALVKNLPMKRINLLIEDPTDIAKKRYVLLGCEAISFEHNFPQEDYYCNLIKFVFEKKEELLDGALCENK